MKRFIIILMSLIMTLSCVAGASYTPDARAPEAYLVRVGDTFTRYWFKGDSNTVYECVQVSDGTVDSGTIISFKIGTRYGQLWMHVCENDPVQEWKLDVQTGEFTNDSTLGRTIKEANWIVNNL